MAYECVHHSQSEPPGNGGSGVVASVATQVVIPRAPHISPPRLRTTEYRLYRVARLSLPFDPPPRPLYTYLTPRPLLVGSLLTA